MKKVTIKIIKNDTPKRNELHFEVQRKTRVQIVESKKKYNRKKLGRISMEE